MVSFQVINLVLQHCARFNRRLLNDTANAAEALVTQHLHLVNSVDYLWRLLDLLVYYLDGCVVRAIRVLLELHAVVN